MPNLGDYLVELLSIKKHIICNKSEFVAIHKGFYIINNNSIRHLSLLFVYLPVKTKISHIFTGASCQNKYWFCIGFAAQFES